MTIPKIVAQPMTADEVGWSFFDSTESCVVDAASSALLICDAREGLRSLHQPVGRARLDVELAHRVLGDHRVRRRGPGRQRPDLLDHRVRETARGGRTALGWPCRSWSALATRCVVEDETRDAREAGT